jgi:hypothetical protein
LQKGDDFINNRQPSLFDRGEVGADDTLKSVDEVLAMAHEVLGRQVADGEAGDGSAPPLAPALEAARARRLERAAALGLVARWADYKTAKGHIAIHDPASGEWAEVPYKDAPGWAQRETGDARVFDYDAATMRDNWEEEQIAQGEEDEGIVEENPLPDD